MVSKELPHDTLAEQSILGIILSESERIDLQVSDFYHIEHQKIFKAMKNLWDRGVLPDIVTVSDELKKSGELEEIGGITYLMNLAKNAIGFSNLEYYVKIVREKSALRKAFELSEKITNSVYNNDLESVRGLGMQIANLYASEVEKPFSETFTPEDYERLASTKRWTSHIEKMTRFVPFMRGENIYLAGKTSTGKTQLALNLAWDFVAQGAKVGYVSMELGREQLLIRLINWELGDDANSIMGEWRLAQIDLRDKHWWNIGMQIITQEQYKNFYFTEEIYYLEDLESWVEGHKFDVVFIDYIQLLKSTHKFNSRNEELEYIARELRRISKKHCVVILSQFNRYREEDEAEIDLSRLRDSGALEQTATSVILIRRDQDEPHNFFYAVAKNQTFGTLSNGWKKLELLPSGRFKEV
jgi:replicative DNA helicase